MQHKQDIPQSLEMSGVEQVFNQKNDIEGREGGRGGEERGGRRRGRSGGGIGQCRTQVCSLVRCLQRRARQTCLLLTHCNGEGLSVIAYY